MQLAKFLKGCPSWLPCIATTTPPFLTIPLVLVRTLVAITKIYYYLSTLAASWAQIMLFLEMPKFSPTTKQTTFFN
jgi:hypothetical protein